ncbi:MAG: hypothetical protein E6778_14170 [Niallia nealsonii]|nr:hypothetical protein [Niallia nealsonii]
MEVRHRVNFPIKLLLVTLSITSFLVFPMIQGTTISYLLCFFIFFYAVFLDKNRGVLFYKDIVITIFIIFLVTLLAQLFLSFSGIISFNEYQLKMIDKLDNNVLFRQSMFTQLLYLLAVIFFFYFTKYFYTVEWDKYLFYGINALCIYGIYEFLYFLIFKENGDFLSNRKFGSNMNISGSLFQGMEIGPFTLQRIKSLTGEPSMFAFSTIPFFYYAFFTKRYKSSILLFITNLLSFSTTAYLGIIIFIIYIILKTKKYLKIIYLFTFSSILLLWIIGFEKIGKYIYDAILRKLLTDSVSTVNRASSMVEHLNFFLDMPFFNKVFGIGFGYVRSSDYFSSILINNGILGFLVLTILFFYPIIKISNLSNRIISLKLSLVFSYIAMMIAVPEFAYLTSWLFLGMVYNLIWKNNIDRKSNLKY